MPRKPGDRSGRKILTPERISLSAAILVPCLVYLFLMRTAFDFTIDDTFISLRYAKNLAVNNELAWNLGETVKTEGYTSLTWVILCALIFTVPIRTNIHLVKVMSVLFGMF